MHEASLVMGLLGQADRLVRSHRAARVTRVRVRMGELSGVDADSFRFAFDALSPESVCAGAVLEILSEPAAWVCSRCEAPMEPGDRLQCAACGLPARLQGGDGLVLETLEMETA